MQPPTVAGKEEKRELLLRAIEQDEEKLLAGIRTYIYKFGLASDRESVATLAREVLHEALISAERNSARYDPARPAYPWVLTHALNHIRNLRRKQRHEVRIADEACRRGADPVLSEEEMLRILTQHADSTPADAPTAAEILSLLEDADRELLQRRYLEKMEYPELAGCYGENEATMRKRVSRAKQRAREAYEAMERFARGDH